MLIYFPSQFMTTTPNSTERNSADPREIHSTQGPRDLIGPTRSCPHKAASCFAFAREYPELTSLEKHQRPRHSERHHPFLDLQVRSRTQPPPTGHDRRQGQGEAKPTDKQSSRPDLPRSGLTNITQSEDTLVTVTLMRHAKAFLTGLRIRVGCESLKHAKDLDPASWPKRLIELGHIHPSALWRAMCDWAPSAKSW